MGNIGVGVLQPGVAHQPGIDHQVGQSIYAKHPRRGELNGGQGQG